MYGRIGEKIEKTIPVLGFMPPFEVHLIDGELPRGLSLCPYTGAITGTPEESGDFEFVLEATGADGTKLSNTFHLKVSGADS